MIVQRPSPNHDGRPAGGAIDMLVLHYTGMQDGAAALCYDRGDLRARSLESIKGVQWLPSWGEERIRGLDRGAVNEHWCGKAVGLCGVQHLVHPLTGEDSAEMAQEHQQCWIVAQFVGK